MTVESQTAKVTRSGNGVATSFSFSPLVIYESGNLVVTKTDANDVETTLSEGATSTTYSVTVASYPGTGTITYPASGGTPLATGETLTIKRVLTAEQTLDLENQGGYFADLQETALDKLVMLHIQQQEEIDRSLKLPVSADTADLEELSAALLVVAAIEDDVVAAANVMATSSFKYLFDSSTSMADPGTGDVRFNHATIASVTAIAISKTFSGGSDISDYIVTWDDATHTPASILTIRRSGDADFFIKYGVTAVADNTDWLQLTVTHIASGGGTLTNADQLFLCNQPSGTDGVTQTRASLSLATSDSPEFAGINLGHASDTTLTRVSAGVVAVEGKTVGVLSSAQSFTKTQSVTPVTLTSSAGSIAVDLSLSNNFEHTLTENTTLANPSNIVAGTSGQIAFTNHASSPKTLAYGSFWDFVGGTAPTLTASNSARDTLYWYARSTTQIEAVLLKNWS